MLTWQDQHSICFAWGLTFWERPILAPVRESSQTIFKELNKSFRFPVTSLQWMMRPKGRDLLSWKLEAGNFQLNILQTVVLLSTVAPPLANERRRTASLQRKWSSLTAD
jgi:hypothetical protein